jgi:hypothetical protein
VSAAHARTFAQQTVLMRTRRDREPTDAWSMQKVCAIAAAALSTIGDGPTTDAARARHHRPSAQGTYPSATATAALQSDPPRTP